MKKQENLLMKGKWLTGALVLAMAAVTLAGCGAKDETKENGVIFEILSMLKQGYVWNYEEY